jgi:hypothetical protein
MASALHLSSPQCDATDVLTRAVAFYDEQIAAPQERVVAVRLQ